jgi:hypothetical protein
MSEQHANEGESNQLLGMLWKNWDASAHSGLCRETKRAAL